MQDFLSNLWAATIKYGRWKMYLQGLGVTLLIAGIACLIGIVLGLLVAVIKIYAKDSKNPVLKVLSGIANAYTTVIRGTPVMVQLLILYGIGAISGLTVCIIGFGVNSGAYVSEIFRGGINSVDVGQMEAGRSLGLSRNTTMRHIILPQAIKNILPPLFNEFIALIKETSIAGAVAVNELTKAADRVKGTSYNTLPIYIVAVIYLVLVYGLTLLQRKLERRYGRSDRS